MSIPLLLSAILLCSNIPVYNVILQVVGADWCSSSSYSRYWFVVLFTSNCHESCHFLLILIKWGVHFLRGYFWRYRCCSLFITQLALSLFRSKIWNFCVEFILNIIKWRKNYLPLSQLQLHYLVLNCLRRQLSNLYFWTWWSGTFHVPPKSYCLSR